MRKIDSIEELKSIQLNILLAFHRFCLNNGLKYSLAAGSLIGAIRHKGFIPWDDDIDVYMLREDYEKLVSIFPSMYESQYKFVSMERDGKWHRTYGLLYDSRTIKKEHVSDSYCEMGIGIDVFPIDDVPDKLSEWTRYNKLRILLRNMFTMKLLLVSSERSIWKNVLIVLSKIILFLFSYKLFAQMINKYSQIHNGKGCSHVYENCLGVYNSKHPWLKKSFDDTIDTEFEEHQVKIMKGYDDYLTCVYGDYMQLPPEEKRVTHHAFEAYWK
ncbi:MAG: LicD family protein [Prevotella sp.]|nr:LicD family protein [Prevotella sp.]